MISRCSNVAVSTTRWSARVRNSSVRRCSSPAFCVSRRCCTRPPAAWMAAGCRSGLRPKPSSDAVPSCSTRVRSARSRSKSAGSTAVIGALACSRPGRAAAARSLGSRISRGRTPASSSTAAPAADDPRCSVTRNSPVDRSAVARPKTVTDPSSARATAIRKAGSLASRTPASVRVPGETTRTTSRRTMPRALRGSSTCSHTATRKPCLTRRAR